MCTVHCWPHLCRQCPSCLCLGVPMAWAAVPVVCVVNFLADLATPACMLRRLPRRCGDEVLTWMCCLPRLDDCDALQQKRAVTLFTQA